MLKRIFILSLLVLVGNLTVTPLVYGSDKTDKTDKEAKFAEKVKTEIAKLGVGKEAKIKVKLKDGTKLKGFVSEIKEDNFTITNEKTGVATTVSYSQPKQVKGNNLSSGTIIAIGVVVAVFILGIIAASS